MRDAIREAHFDGRLPDDWIYESARSIVDSLSEHDDPDDDTKHEICDGLVDIYTGALIAWLAQNNLNAGLVDEAQREGLTSEESTLDQRIQMAQYMALTYICGALQSAIEAHVEQMEPEYYAAHDCEICDPIEHCSHLQTCGKCGDEFTTPECPRCNP
jgi:hypothetical protein